MSKMRLLLIVAAGISWIGGISASDDPRACRLLEVFKLSYNKAIVSCMGVFVSLK